MTAGTRLDAPPRRGAGSLSIAVVGGAAACLVALALMVERVSYDVWAALWIGPLLLLVTIPIARRVARTEGDPGLARFLMIAAAAKVIGGSLARYATESVAYGGLADAGRYHDEGSALAPMLRQGIYEDLGALEGTRFIDVVTGQIYAFTGPTSLGGFLVYSWLAFLGLVLFYRAFRVAVPDGNARRYRLLLFFFPAMLFWPSGTGKDAWMVLCLGAATYGAARLLRGSPKGLLWAAPAVWGAAVVRPHLPLMLMVGLGAAIIVGATAKRTESTSRRRGAGLVTIAFFVVATGVVVSQAEARFGLERLEVSSADDVLEGRTDIGGSRFEGRRARDPVSFVTGTITVLFRPFPHEATNVQMAVASIEGIILLVLIWRSLPALARLPTLARKAPYAALALAYVSAFVYGFSGIENFGILARQRVQLLPVLFVLLCLPMIASRRSPDPDGGIEVGTAPGLRT